MVVGIAEFLGKVAKLRSTQAKIDAIAHNDSVPLRIILQSGYDPEVVWLLPPGDPPYKPNELVDQEHILIREADKLKYFIKGFNDNLQQTKRERMFVEFIERLAPEDAKMILQLKDKKPLKGITLEHVVKGLPGLIPSVTISETEAVEESNEQDEV